MLHLVFSVFTQGEDESMVSSLFQCYLHSLHSQHISTDHLLSDIKGALKSHTKTESSRDTCDKKCDMEVHSPPESENSLFSSRENMSGRVQTQEIVLIKDSTETHDTNVEFGGNLKTAQVQEGSSELEEEQVREGGVLVADEAAENVKRCAGEPVDVRDVLAADISRDDQAELQAALRRLEEEERERKENLLKEQQEREVGMLKLTAYCK